MEHTTSRVLPAPYFILVFCLAYVGPLKWRRCVPMKRGLSFTELHGTIITQKTELFSLCLMH
jgi:hypothetical protein